MVKDRSEPQLDRELANLPPELRWREWMRRIEAVLFASASPVPREDLARIVGQAASVDLLVEDLAADLEGRAIEIAQVAGGWMFRTRPVYAPAIRAAADVGDQLLDLNEFDVAILAAIAYHQPITRDGLKDIFGKEISRDLIGRLSEPVAVSWHAVRIEMEKLGDASPRVLVQGGGAIGLGAALVARLMGAGSVHVAEPHSGRRASVAREAGIIAFDPMAHDPGPDAFDLIIDAVGAVATRRDASRLVRPGGVIVHVGLLPGNEGYDIRRITLQEITVSGSYCYTPDDFAAALAALGEGRLGDLGWVDSRPLSDGAISFADLDAGRVDAAKIVLELG